MLTFAAPNKGLSRKLIVTYTNITHYEKHNKIVGGQLRCS